MSKLHAIADHFSQKKCQRCDCNYSFDSLFVLRDDSHCVVVRVVCEKCSLPLGVAIIGTASADKSKRKQKPVGPPPITKDDVIDAHNFFNSLGSDWAKHLPKVK